MKRVLFVICTCMLTLNGFCQQFEPLEVIKLYEGAAPGTESWKHKEMIMGEEGNISVYNVVDPVLTVYLPESDKATGAAMVVCPGGGFTYLSYTDEGILAAEELCKRGIAAFLLKYRTSPVLDEHGESVESPTEVLGRIMPIIIETVQNQSSMSERVFEFEYSHLAFEDADRAMTIVRQNAAKWGIRPDKIGIMGFSAGAITTLHQAQVHTAASKPDFTGVIYGGWTPDVTVPTDAAPMFMCSPVTDVFLPQETWDVYQAWRTAKIPVELHYYNDCGHGFGAKKFGKSCDYWIDEMFHFMQDVDFVELKKLNE